MDERQKIDLGLQAKKLLLQLEKRQALPTNHHYRMAALDEEIAAVEKLISSYRHIFAKEHLESARSISDATPYLRRRTG
jgi:hypothetical protein